MNGTSGARNSARKAPRPVTEAGASQWTVDGWSRVNGSIPPDRLSPDKTGAALQGAMQSREVAVFDPRKLIAEFVGTAILVFAAVGTATLSFGFKLFGTSYSAGVVTTALAFGLVLMALVYAIGPISGCHVNPAVSLGFVVAGRMKVAEAAGYWFAQIAGGIAGAYALWAVFTGSPLYSKSVQGLGADGYGSSSKIHLGVGGAFAAEAVLTFIFVMVILFATSKIAREALAGLAIGVTLVFVHLVGIALTGTSVNPARSIGPALVVGGTALSQLWLFIVAPLVGGAIAAVFYGVMTRESTKAVPSDTVTSDPDLA
jgi:aquaporin Z